MVSNFFGAAAESALCIRLGQAYDTLHYFQPLCDYGYFSSNYKCRVSICSLLSQVTLGALLLGFFVCFRWPVLFGIGICNCGLSDTVVLSSDNKTFCASFCLYYFVVVPSLKNIYCSLCICLLYIWLFPVSCWCTCARLLGVYLRVVLLGHWVFEWDFTWLHMSDIFCTWAGSYFDYILRCLLRCFISICPLELCESLRAGTKYHWFLVLHCLTHCLVSQRHLFSEAV